MTFQKIREAIENPPKGCLMECGFHKTTHTGVWSSRSKCKLLNRDLTNHDFQGLSAFLVSYGLLSFVGHNRPLDCPFRQGFINVLGRADSDYHK